MGEEYLINVEVKERRESTMDMFTLHFSIASTIFSGSSPGSTRAPIVRILLRTVPVFRESSHIKYAFSWYEPFGIMNTFSRAG